MTERANPGDATNAADDRIPELPELRVLARDVLAASRRIDAVAVDSAGGVHAIVRAAAGADAAALTRALGAAAWLRARLDTWAQLAPDAGIALGTAVRAVVLAPTFEAETELAASELGPERARLALASGAAPRTPAARADAGATPRPSSPAIATTPSRFRTGLSDAELERGGRGGPAGGPAIG